jgi:hypothetical protein
VGEHSGWVGAGLGWVGLQSGWVAASSSAVTLSWVLGSIQRAADQHQGMLWCWLQSGVSWQRSRCAIWHATAAKKRESDRTATAAAVCREESDQKLISGSKVLELRTLNTSVSWEAGHAVQN